MRQEIKEMMADGLHEWRRRLDRERDEIEYKANAWHDEDRLWHLMHEMMLENERLEEKAEVTNVYEKGSCTFNAGSTQNGDVMARV